MAEAIVHPDGRVVLGRLVLRAALGRGGVRQDKSEGDGATPIGLLPLRRVLYRADLMPPPLLGAALTGLPREPIAATDGWCDDPGHADYNRQVRLPHPARHEELWRRDGAYDLVVVLGWNDAPVQRSRGSAIFLHVARPDLAPTEGCVALALPDLRALLEAGPTALRVLAP
jgi:L,D-peptidoglycan transpeptidase YkuD (ErfK/YbiS/YcfS/YnhG family)